MGDNKIIPDIKNNLQIVWIANIKSVTVNSRQEFGGDTIPVKDKNFSARRM
jgi:hypothetical protein